MYFFWNPTEGPFIIIPSLDEPGKTTQFRLTSPFFFLNFSLSLFLLLLLLLLVFSNNPVQLERLQEEKNAVLFGQWTRDLSAGGCHLYEEEKDIQQRTWTMNP